MSISIEQYRSAIGRHDCFIKCKENALLCALMRIIRELYNFFGPILILMLLDHPYSLLALLLILLRGGDIEVNPGPPSNIQNTKICHINARSLLSDTDIDLHLDSQCSLLDDI